MNLNYRTQGRCPKCKVRHTWPERLGTFSGSVCPDCGTELKRTTYRVQLPVKDWPIGLGVTVSGSQFAAWNESEERRDMDAAIRKVI